MNKNTTTYAAVLTPIAPGAIAVISVAGDATERVVAACCRTRGGVAATFEVDRPRLVQIRDGDDVLDDAIVTAIDCGGVRRIEICIHGGVRIVERVMNLLRRSGAGVVDATEFEGRFGGGDAVARDVDRALIRAGSRRLAEWLLAQRRLLPEYLKNWSSQGAEEIAAYRRRTTAAIRAVRGARVALAGPPNAGKSTLANRLIGHQRIIVSDMAGTTRDWVDETAVIDGWPVTLTDTAGVRETDCQIEVEAIRRGAAQARSSDLVVVLVDGTADVETRRQAAAVTLEAVGSEAPTLVVVNKVDAAPETAGEVADRSATFISALSGVGVEALEGRMAQALGFDLLDVNLATGFLPAHLDGRAEAGSERMDP